MAITFELASIPAGPYLAGNPILISALNPAGGTPPYQYAFYEFNGSGWALKQDYGISTSYIWRPATIANGQLIQVWIKDAVHVGPDPYDALQNISPIDVIANGSWIKYNEIAKRYEISKNVGLIWNPLDISGHLTNYPPLDGTNIFSGDNQFSLGIKERSRTTRIGEWIIPAYNGANFSALAPMTWSVAQAGVMCYKYTLIGKSLHLNFYLKGTTGGTASNTLNIAIPGGFISSADQQPVPITVYEGGATFIPAYALAPPGDNKITCIKNDWSNFGIGADRWAFGQITLEVQV